MLECGGENINLLLEGKLEEIATGIQGTFEYVSFSGDLSSILCGSYQEVAIWDHWRKTKKHAVLFKPSVETVEISPDGSQFAVGLDNGQIQLWDVESGQIIQTFDEHTSGVSILVFSSDRNMASGSSDGSI